MKDLHERKSFENLRQPFAKNAPSRTQALVFFSFGDPLNEAGEVSIVNTGEAHHISN